MYVKIIGLVALGGAAVGAYASQKLGGYFRGDEKRAKANRTQVRVVEIPVDTDDPSELDFVVLKRTKKTNKTNN